MKIYLSHTNEFSKAVASRRAEAIRRTPWPCRIILAALDGYLSELRHMLDAPISPGPGR